MMIPFDCAAAGETSAGRGQRVEAGCGGPTRVADADVCVRGRLRAFFDATADGLATLDAAGIIVDANAVLAEMLGASEASIVGRPLAAFLAPAAAASFTQQVRDWLAAGNADRSFAPTALELRGGGAHPVAVEVRGGAWSAHGLTYLGLTIRDRTQQDLLERQLRSVQKMEALGQLAGGVAHDFNNILAAIRAFSDLLGETLEVRDERQRDVARIQEAVDRGAALVRQLLAFSRQQVLQPLAVDVNALLARVADMLGRTLPERVALETSFAADAGTVFVDPVQLEQIVLNLVLNARDAIPLRGHVRISTRRERALPAARTSLVDASSAGDFVVISVGDDGVGMDEATQARIFEPFFTTKEQGRGTGLGLATVYGIVRQSSGYVHVRSAPGRGATFDVYLPRYAASVRPPSVRVPAPAPAAVEGEARSILLVEDDRLVRQSFARVLRAEGWRVVEEPSAERALELVTESPQAPDVVLSDVLLPGMTGVELAQELRLRRPGVPVVLISGHDGGELRDVGVLPAVQVLAKPIAGPALVAAVRAALGRSRGGAGPERGAADGGSRERGETKP